MIPLQTLKRLLVSTRLLERPVYRAKRSPLYNALRFGLWTDRYLPETVHVETTSACNARCGMCPREKTGRPVQAMAPEVYDKVLADLAPLGGLGVVLQLHHLGEPLLDPDLVPRIRRAKERLRRVRVHFNTNASLLDEDRAREVLDSGLDSITFSIDGASAATYGALRPGLDFGRVTANVRRFLDLRRAAGRRRPHVTVQMVVGAANRHEAEAFRRAWQGSADAVYRKAMLDFLVQGTSTKTAALAPRQVRRCYQPVAVAVVYADGRLGLCCWDHGHLARLGSVTEGNLLDLFNDAAHQRVRRAMLDLDCSAVEPCRRCAQVYGRDMDAVWREREGP